MKPVEEETVQGLLPRFIDAYQIIIQKRVTSQKANPPQKQPLRDYSPESPILARGLSFQRCSNSSSKIPKQQPSRGHYPTLIRVLPFQTCSHFKDTPTKEAAIKGLFPRKSTIGIYRDPLSLTPSTFHDSHIRLPQSQTLMKYRLLK